MISCEDCGKKITGRGKSNKCMSCVKKGNVPVNKTIGNEIICKICLQKKDITLFPKTKNGHRKMCCECYKEYIKKKHKENNGYKEKRKKYREKHREEIKEKAKEYYKNNKDKRREYYNRKRKEDINFKLKESFRIQILKSLKTNSANFSISKTLGYEIKKIKLHLESQFDENMSWNNHGIYWHIDHIIPQSLFDFSNENEIKKCWNYRNLRPLKVEDNLIKINKLMFNLIEEYKIEDLLPIGV